MSSTPSTQRFPWIALVLSFLSSGVGHLYCGRIAQGLFLYGARFLLPLLCVLAALTQPANIVLIGLIILPVLAMVIIFFYSAIDAWAIAGRTDSNYQLKDYNRASLYWLLIVMQLACSFGLIWGVREYVYEPYYLPTRSMSPNFLPNDRLLANKHPFTNSFPERGDAIVFHTPATEKGKMWIKRVIGVAGDEIVIKGREITINGKRLERENVPAESLSDIRNHVEGEVQYESNGNRRYKVLFAEEPNDSSEAEEFSVTVPPRSVFVMGDNRDRSRDSRHIGSIHAGDVIGHIDYIYYPTETWSRFGVIED